MDPKALKLLVQEKYGDIAKQSKIQNETSCCGATACCAGVDYSIFSENYQQLDGYAADADLGLGCGLPTQYADIHKGDSVLDLGSGAGNDCFVARSLVGEEGQVTGIDFTEAMLEKARANNAKLGFDNVTFVQGDIEDIPLDDNQFDVIVSNCVLNLVPDKEKAFGQIYRVLKPGGHFCVSDVVLRGNMPESLIRQAELYAGCVSGAIDVDQYLDIVHRQGFTGLVVHKMKEIVLPEEILNAYFTPEEIATWKSSGTGIFSVTVSAQKNV